MNKIFISHTKVALPKEAVQVDVDIIDPKLLEVMCAEHTPIIWKSLQSVYVFHNFVYAPIPALDSYYRVEATWM